MRFLSGITRAFLSAAFAISVVTACGGGGGGGGEDVPAPIASGSVTLLAGSPGEAGSIDVKPGRFNSPEGVAQDSAGNVYVADTGNRTVRKVTLDGNVTTLAGAPGQSGSTDGAGAAARFLSPVAVAVDAGGNIFVADGGPVRKISPAGVVSTLGTDTSVRASDVALDASGNLFVVNGRSVLKYAANGTVSTVLADLGVLGASVIGVAVDGAGNLYVAERLGFDTLGIGAVGWIRRFNNQGVEVPYATAATAGLLAGTLPVAYPTGIAADAAGNLYVACGGNVQRNIPAGSVDVCSSIEKVTPAGQLTTVAGKDPLNSVFGTDRLGSADGPGPIATFRHPQGVSVGAGGRLVVADTENHAIRQIAP